MVPLRKVKTMQLMLVKATDKPGSSRIKLPVSATVGVINMLALAEPGTSRVDLFKLLKRGSALAVRNGYVRAIPALRVIE
jgi:hypothetical protein